MTIKRILTILIFCSLCVHSFAQQITIKSIESRLITNQGVEFIGELKDESNNEYTYPNWSNRGILFLESKAYYLSNLNFNITTNSFESRVNAKQFFSFKSSLIDSVSINNHLYKQINNTFYEVLLENGNSSFLRKYDVVYKSGIQNRLTGVVGKSQASLIYKYLVKFDDKFILLDFDKKSILSLVDDEFQKTLEGFIEIENLSYKRENDIVKILEFVFKNSDQMI